MSFDLGKVSVLGLQKGKFWQIRTEVVTALD